MRLRRLALLAACCSPPAPRLQPVNRAPDAARSAHLPDLPGLERLEPARDRPAGGRDSAAMISAIGLDAPVHPDFGSFLGYGIPYNVVSGKKVHKVHVSFDYADESDKRRLPDACASAAGGGGDAPRPDRRQERLPALRAVRGARERRHAGRPARARSGTCARTTCVPTAGRSADAAGLPILPGLVRYDEVAAGRHPARAALHGRAHGEAHIYPARHDAGDSDGSLPPMGLRVRLKASVDISGYGKQARVVAAGAQDLRDDPGRQRQPLVHLGRQQQALRRRRPARARQDHRARTSRSSTPRSLRNG